MLRLVNETVRESIGVKRKEYRFKNYRILVETDLAGKGTPVYEIQNLAEKSIQITKISGEDPMLSVAHFLSPNQDEIVRFIEELESGRQLLECLPELEKENQNKETR